MKEFHLILNVVNTALKDTDVPVVKLELSRMISTMSFKLDSLFLTTIDINYERDCNMSNGNSCCFIDIY
jgi:hypothetical protein